MRTAAKSVLILCGLLASCSTTTAPAFTAWEGTLSAMDPHDLIEGSVAVNSQRDRLNAGIQVNNAPSGQTLTWQLRSGTCAAPGDIVGGRAVYPVLAPDVRGSATAEALVDRSLHTDGQYQASVLDTTAAVIACGPLTRR